MRHCLSIPLLHTWILDGILMSAISYWRPLLLNHLLSLSLFYVLAFAAHLHLNSAASTAIFGTSKSYEWQRTPFPSIPCVSVCFLPPISSWSITHTCFPSSSASAVLKTWLSSQSIVVSTLVVQSTVRATRCVHSASTSSIRLFALSSCPYSTPPRLQPLDKLHFSNT